MREVKTGLLLLVLLIACDSCSITSLFNEISINKVKADILLKIDCGFIPASQLPFKLNLLWI